MVKSTNFVVFGFWAVNALLSAQSVSQHQGRRFLVDGTHLLEQSRVDGAYAVIPGWPSLAGEMTGTGATTICWDGALLYRLSFEDQLHAQVQCGFLSSPSPERPQALWYWRPPVLIEGRMTLLGGWDGQALVAQPLPKPDSEARATAAPTGWALSLVDLSDGQSREVFQQLVPNLPVLQSIMIEGDAYVFTSTGTAIRVDCVTRHAEVITEDFWAEAGFDLCRDPGSVPNPRVMGRPFLDPEGAITLPVQPKVFLDEADIQRAWSTLDESRRRELIEQGHWPPTPGRKIGWKDQAGFIRFSPEARTWRGVEASRYAALVEWKDRHFMTLEFRPNIDDTTLFMWEKGAIVPFKVPEAPRRGQPNPGAAPSRQRPPSQP